MMLSTRQCAREAALRHGIELDQIFTTNRATAVVAARREVWRRLHSDGLTYGQIGRETGHTRSAVYLGVKGSEPPTDSRAEGLRIVLANIAAMQAKHQRDLAQRY